MKSLISFMVLCMVAVPVAAATGRIGVTSPVTAANRIAPSPSKIASMKVYLATPTVADIFAMPVSAAVFTASCATWSHGLR